MAMTHPRPFIIIEIRHPFRTKIESSPTQSGYYWVEIIHTTPGKAFSGVGESGGDDVLESLLDSFEEPHPPLPHTCPS